MSRGMQPLGIDVAVTDREEERDELVTIFLRDGRIDSDERRFLDRHETRTNRLREIVHCVWTGLAWLRCLTTTGRTRAKELERQYTETYGPMVAD